jgi:hypothetical protein
MNSCRAESTWFIVEDMHGPEWPTIDARKGENYIFFEFLPAH